MVACARLGLRTKYIGTIGDDERGRIQMESLQGHRHQSGSRAASRKDCPNQSAYIIIDRSTGERTVLWRRDDCLRIDPERDHAGADRLRAPAAHRRARYAGRGARRRRSRARTEFRSPWTSIPSITASTGCCRTSITWWRQLRISRRVDRRDAIRSKRSKRSRTSTACGWPP